MAPAHLSICLMLALAVPALWQEGTAADATPPARYVLWKFDDLRVGPVSGVGAGFNRVVEYCKEKRMKASIGIICNSFDKPTAAFIAWIKANAIENGGLIEFWNHGWDHSQKPTAQADSEFKGTDLAFQLDHLAKANRAMAQATGITFHAFGSPFNATDAVTIQAMAQMPDYAVWLYGPANASTLPSSLTVLGRTLNLEFATGKVAAGRFLDAYAASHDQHYLLLQGHAGMWDGESFTSFTTIVDRLSADGWIFATPSEYARLVQQGRPAPVR